MQIVENKEKLVPRDHPESQGSIERSQRVLSEYLRHYVEEDQTNWDEWVPFAAYAYNTSEHSATGYTPFELVFGHPSSLSSALRSEPSPRYNYDDYVSELKGRLQTVHYVANKNLKVRFEAKTTMIKEQRL